MDNLALLQHVRIRLAQENDLPALEWQGELIHFRNLFSEAFDQTRQGNAEIWLAELRESWFRPSFLIGQLILSLRFFPNGNLNSVYLYGFRVKSGYRSQGVGSLMLERVESSLRKRGCQTLTLNVARDNPEALHLYERKSFRVVGEEEGHWYYTDHEGVRREVCEPAWRMEKRL